MEIHAQRQPLITTFLQKNQQLNLSAIRDEEGVFVKHIQDSLTVLNVVDFTPNLKVADLGTGGGFPLMPLAISCPEVEFTGIDSVRKKTIAVNEMLTSLGVKNAKVLRTRIEEVKDQFDIVTARAVAHVEKLIPRAYPLVKPWGKFVLLKQSSPEEYQALLTLCKKKKIKLIQNYEYQLFEGDIQRVIYVLEKE